MSTNPQYRSALIDFQKMRRRVALQNIFALAGKQPQLLSYQSVREQLHAVEKPNTELREIPIKAIQGSVGRYADFTQDFLPKASVDPQRWARVKTQFSSLEGVPPIDVYQIGEVYFVIDGNHRVSVARGMGNQTIEAYVREVKSRVPLKLDEDLDQFILKAELAEFLDATQIDHLLPEVDFTVTVPGRYTIILQQIEAIHFSLEIQQNQSVPYERAVKSWYDQVYYPIVALIREQHILAEYPQRTEADLVLWIAKHRAALAKSLGWEITTDSAVKALPPESTSNLERLRERARLFFSKIIPVQAINGPTPGTWRQEKLANPQGRLFGNILVVVDGTSQGWQALTQSLMIADLEGSQLFGLHISAPNNGIKPEEKRSIQTEFEERCRANNASGQLAFETGEFTEIIVARASWADLVVIPEIALSGENLHDLVQNCPTPLLILKPQHTVFKRLLLAYDGSPKSEEALFLAAYLAIFWELALTVITSLETDHAHITPETILQAREYLESYGVRASYIQSESDPALSILNAAHEKACDLIVLGGYRHHTQAGANCSVLDEVLANSPQAVLICR
ncbi:MAG TPA: hypothetical protein DEH22_16160 [Chloroflexi bacterium]|nr:hypothetical protein [Chloroflexota bacterium]